LSKTLGLGGGAEGNRQFSHHVLQQQDLSMHLCQQFGVASGDTLLFFQKNWKKREKIKVNKMSQFTKI
jgi:hypothetical protein